MGRRRTAEHCYKINILLICAEGGQLSIIIKKNILLIWAEGGQMRTIIK